MFRPETYQEAYGFAPLEVLSELPPIYRIRPIWGRGPAILSTSPFVTHTPFPALEPGVFRSYLERCQELAREHRARFALVKIDRPELAAELGRRFAVELRYNKRVLDLSCGLEEIWKKKLSAKVRNQVRKGERANPLLRVGREELLEPFYQVMAATQTQLGTPVHAKRFFGAILRHNPEAGLLVLSLDDRPVSAALLVHRGDTLAHPYAGTLHEVRHTSVNNYLYWSIIRRGAELGCRTFDMGRSIRGSGNDHYKSTWGTEELPVYYGYHGQGRQSIPRYDSPLVKLATSLWRYLPLPFVTRMGPHFISRVP